MRVAVRERRVLAPLCALAMCTGCSLVKSADDFEIAPGDAAMDADVGPPEGGTDGGGADATMDGGGTDAAMDGGGTDAGMDGAAPDAAGADAGTDAGDAGVDGGAECGDASDCPDRAHIGKSCVAGECVYADCDEGFGDCNDDLSDGCEADLTTAATCGSCASSCDTDELCDSSGGTAECILDCDATVCGDLCVDTATNPAHCGGCDAACDVPDGAESATCTDSTCGFVCAADRADCNGSPGDGCEIDTASDTDHCGGCGMACPLAAVCSSARCIPEHLWTVPIGDTDDDDVGGVAVDGSDHTVVAGDFTGTVDFGGETRTSAGESDAFVARYDPSGVLDWVVAIGGAGIDLATDVGVDGSDNVYVAGHYRESVDFGDGTDRSSNGESDVFVVSFDSSGAFRWVTTFGGAARNAPLSIAVSSTGASFVGGLYEGDMTIGSDSLSAVEVFDGWVAALDTDGSPRWARSIGPGATQVVTGVALDEGGDLYVAGYFSFRVRPTSGVDHDAAGGFDAFVASYQIDGTYQWSARYGDGPDQRALGVTAGPSGIVLTGWFEGNIDFGGGAMSSAGLADGFVAALGFDGTHDWSKRFGAAGDDRAVDSAFDSSGNLVVTGLARASVDLGGGSLTSNGNADVVVVSYDAGGTHRWSRMFGSSVYDDGRAVDTAGTDFVVTGQFGGTADFGGGGVTAEGLRDVFVARFAQ